MTHVPDNLVFVEIECLIERQGEFNDAQSRSKVPPTCRDNLEMTLSDLPSNIRKLCMSKPMQLVGMCQISEMHAQPTPIHAIYEVLPTIRGLGGIGRMAQ